MKQTKMTFKKVKRGQIFKYGTQQYIKDDTGFGISLKTGYAKGDFTGTQKVTVLTGKVTLTK